MALAILFTKFQEKMHTYFYTLFSGKKNQTELKSSMNLHIQTNNLHNFKFLSCLLKKSAWNTKKIRKTAAKLA